MDDDDDDEGGGRDCAGSRDGVCVGWIPFWDMFRPFRHTKGGGESICARALCVAHTKCPSPYMVDGCARGRKEPYESISASSSAKKKTNRSIR